MWLSYICNQSVPMYKVKDGVCQEKKSTHAASKVFLNFIRSPFYLFQTNVKETLREIVAQKGITAVKYFSFG